MPTRVPTKTGLTPLQTVINIVVNKKSTSVPSKKENKVGITKGLLAPVIVKEGVKPLQEKASEELQGTERGNPEKEYPKWDSDRKPRYQIMERKRTL
jgi:hypothetical protein